MKSLSAQRKKMDQLNKSLAKLLLARLKLMQKITEKKHKMGLKFRDLNREKQILRKISKITKHKNKKHYLQNIFSQIFKENTKFKKELK